MTEIAQNPKLRRSLILHEDYRKYPYIDTLGKVSFGIGYNASDRGMDDQWINNQYEQDVTYFYNQFNSNFNWFKDLNLDRQIVLIDMCFMGWKRFLEFKGLISALSIHDYKKAAQEMLNSLWAQQVKGRALALSKGMETGIYDV